MPPPGVHKYFLAVIPPAPLKDTLHKLKVYFHETYQSKAALKSPPHLTLHMPFQWKAEKEDRLVNALQSFAVGRPRFEIALTGFGAFVPRVIYVAVQDHEPLKTLQQELHRFCKGELNLFNAQYQDQPFHPHFTLAFRDLKKPQFSKAWDEFKDKSFSEHFEVDRIVLLKHDGKVWRPHVNCCF